MTMPTLRDEIDEIERRNAESLDERGCLKDGHRLRVAMMVRDGENTEDARRKKKTTQFYRPGGQSAGSAVTEIEEEDADEEEGAGEKKQKPRVVDAQGRSDPVSLGIPGPRYLTDHEDQYRTVADARAEAIAKSSNAWRDERWFEPAGGRWLPNQGRPQTVGSPCPINGAPGTLQIVGNDLVCVPSRAAPEGPTNDPAEGRRRKDAAYSQMLADKANAWKAAG